MFSLCTFKKSLLSIFVGVYLLSSPVLATDIFQGVSLSDLGKIAKKLKHNYNKARDLQQTPLEETPTPSSRTMGIFGKNNLRFPIREQTLFNTQSCDKVIKDSLFTACYDYSKKLSTLISYRVIGEQIKNGNYIKRRPRFYEDNRIPKRYRAKWSDYKNSNMDRGHSRSHASSNWNSRSVYATYTMVNIMPQTPSLNRKAWLKAEKYERLVSFKLGFVDILNIPTFSSRYSTVGRSRVAVPSGFYKVLYNEKEDFRKCFYYPNVFYSDNNRLNDYVVSCDTVRF